MSLQLAPSDIMEFLKTWCRKTRFPFRGNTCFFNNNHNTSQYFTSLHIESIIHSCCIHTGGGKLHNMHSHSYICWLGALLKGTTADVNPSDNLLHLLSYCRPK